MTTTVRTKASQIYRDWLVVDAAGKPLGRVASEVAKLLVGKHKPFYEPHLDCGDYVIVVNAAKVRLSGRKADQMVFYRHSGYPGGLKARTWEEQMKRDPARIIERTVWGMLPKGARGESMLKHLKVYAGPDHPHESQVTGSERAKEAREKAQAEALAQAIASPKPPRRLRPLPVPQPPLEAMVEAPPAEEAAPPPARRPRKKAEAPAAAEAAVEATPATQPPAEETPKRTRARKKAEGPAAAAAGAETSAEAPEEQPKRTRSRKKADEPAAEATATPAAGDEPEKPRRTRARKKSTEEAPAAADEQGEE
ncbi:MAG: hypothetical protein Kow0010_21920 [Dehalococcoidia bacterium]